MFNNMDWITINKTEGRGSAEVKVTAPTYRELVDRMTRLKISTLSKTAYVSIRQEKITPIFELSKNHLIFSNDVVEENINITSNIAWTATVSNNWITLSSYNGDGNSILTISVNESDATERTGSVEFYNSGVLVGSITITYNLFYVEPTEINMTDNLTATINVTSNMEWSVEYNSDWFSVSPMNGNGNGSITVTANAFNDVDREANIDFYINGEIVDSVRVYQHIINENQFYIEPYNEGESITIGLNSSTNATALYYIEGETNDWVALTSNITLPHNKKIYIKNLYYEMTQYVNDTPFNIDGYFNVGGNIVTLLGKMREYYAGCLFRGCSIVDASNLILPATTLVDGCYMYMFRECTSLTTAPELPATELEYYCYSGMFRDCTSLVNVPSILPATTLAYSCYSDMFWGCSSLVTAPSLPATTLAEGCYGYMFNNCTSLVNAPTLPATTLADYCYDCMFWGCSSLVNAPALPATTLTDSCYKGMFNGCTSLVNAPALPATELVGNCYNAMFSGCTSLVNTPELPATTLARNCYWFMFSGCINLETAPVLPATTLVPFCYDNMFDSCTSLNEITMLATDISANYCLNDWVYRVANYGTFYKNPNMDISNFSRGTSGIPEGWEVRDYEI